MEKRKIDTKKLTVLAMLAALSFIVMMVVMFMSVPVFMVMKVIVMMMLSASASSTHKRLSFYFITIDLIRSSRPFVIFIK